MRRYKSCTAAFSSPPLSSRQNHSAITANAGPIWKVLRSLVQRRLRKSVNLWLGGDLQEKGLTMAFITGLSPPLPHLARLTGVQGAGCATALVQSRNRDHAVPPVQGTSGAAAVLREQVPSTPAKPAQSTLQQLFLPRIEVDDIPFFNDAAVLTDDIVRPAPPPEASAEMPEPEPCPPANPWPENLRVVSAIPAATSQTRHEV